MTEEATWEGIKEEVFEGESLDPLLSRIENMRNAIIVDFQYDPIGFHIMAHAFFTFFKYEDSFVEEFVLADMNKKQQMVYQINDLEEPETILKRIDNFVIILSNTYNILFDHRHRYTINRLMWTLTGKEAFIAGMDLAPYILPPPEQKVEPILPDLGAMFG